MKNNINDHIIVLNASGFTNAYDVIMHYGFTDMLPDVDFYEKYYRKNGIDYVFYGWNLKKDERQTKYPSLNMLEKSVWLNL